MLLSGLWNSSHLLPAPETQELEASLASEKKKNSLTWACIKRLESEADSLRKELISERSSHILAEKEVNDLSLQEFRIHQEALLKGARQCLDNLFMAEIGQSFLQSFCLSLQETYLQYSSFLGDMSPHIRHFYEYGFDAAVK